VSLLVSSNTGLLAIVAARSRDFWVEVFAGTSGLRVRVLAVFAAGFTFAFAFADVFTAGFAALFAVDKGCGVACTPAVSSSAATAPT
jgi:hypothetical protein